MCATALTRSGGAGFTAASAAGAASAESFTGVMAPASSTIFSVCTASLNRAENQSSLGIQVRQARQQFFIDIRRSLRRFGNHRRLAAQYQRHILTDCNGPFSGSVGAAR